MSEVTAEVVEATEGATLAAEQRTDGMPVEARLHERIGAFEEALERLRIAAGPEAIHDLRVAARRLTAFVRMWRALVPRVCFRRIVRDARRLRRRAGRARDLEVQAGMLRGRLARHDAPDADALAFMKELEAPLERRRRRVAKRARSRRNRRLVALLSRAEQRLKKDLVSRLAAYEAAHAREQERRRTAIDAVRVVLGAMDDAELHRARIAIEKWRYAAESLDGSRSGAVLDALRRLQDALGAVLDRAALRAALAARIGEPDNGRAARTLASILSELDAEGPEDLQRLRATASGFLRLAEAPADAEPVRAG